VIRTSGFIPEIPGAVAAQIERSPVQFFQTARKMHEAGVVFAMGQAVKVAEFMEGHLGDSFQGGGGKLWLFRRLFRQSGE